MQDEHSPHRRASRLLADWSAQALRTALQDSIRHARASGLSLLQWNVLIHLHEQGPQEVTRLTEIMQVSAAGASQMVERLASGGVVERRPGTSDRRVREVHLTEKGRALVERALDERRRRLDDMVDTLPADEAAALAQALGQLLASASNAGATAASGDPAEGPRS